VTRVEIGGFYTFRAAGWDNFNRRPSSAADGDLVKVIAVPADTQCIVECADGSVALIMADSLAERLV